VKNLADVVLELRDEVNRLANATNGRVADMLTAENAGFVRGLERARDLVAAHGVVAKDYLGIYPQDVIQREIDRVKGGS
jgi:hypothetical protein